MGSGGFRGKAAAFSQGRPANGDEKPQQNDSDKWGDVHGLDAKEEQKADHQQDVRPGTKENHGAEVDIKQVHELSRNSEPKRRPASSKPYFRKGVATDDDGTTQRDRLTEEIVRGTYECMVCCDRVRPSHEVWSCQNCYHIFHLRCIKKWALSPAASTDDTGWRCPGCQNVTAQVPYQYRCFCGKMRSPEWNRYDTPHSCGEQCSKRRSQQPGCVHPCTLQCHPGPCPPCGVYIDRSCSCGNQTMRVRCGQAKEFSCGELCDKVLNCGKHCCPSKCHSGSCSPCEETVIRKCFCDQQLKEVQCTLETADGSNYCCGGTCDKTLYCENHHCSQRCHPGDCEPCKLDPLTVTLCPCGQTPLVELLPADQLRQKCTDPVPTCDKTCSKPLPCGPEDDAHRCQALCHPDACPPCPLTSVRKCRCGGLKKDVPCCDLASEPLVLCEKRCNKKKTCGRHKCLERCCVNTTHNCALICGRKLGCGLHQCEEPCHLGNCPSCWNTSFDELACRCGAAVMYPPIPCNTKPPDCNKPCSRHHDCDHAVTHNCHSEPQCPPCTFLMSKPCYGEHMVRTCIPCYETSVCCGMPCEKPLPCGRHRCPRICHPAPCIDTDFKCTQPCPKVREQCRHPCGLPCHDGDCPQQSCKATVNVTCHCGHRTGTMSCAENQTAFQRLMSSAMASKHHALEDGQTLDITDVIKDGGLNRNSILDCNNECLQIERNRRFALALQLQNPELTSKLKPPIYSDFLKDQMRQNGVLVTSVFNKLTELVESAKQSKQKSRSHAFTPMKSDHRRVIHELAEFFGCETQSYDDEPKKNVVATAFRDKSWLPSASIMAVVQKESGNARPAGKAPPPIPHVTHRNSNLQSLTPSATTPTANAASPNVESSKKPEAPIDYFDYDG